MQNTLVCLSLLANLGSCSALQTAEKSAGCHLIVSISRHEASLDLFEISGPPTHNLLRRDVKSEIRVSNFTDTYFMDDKGRRIHHYRSVRSVRIDVVTFTSMASAIYNEMLVVARSIEQMQDAKGKNKGHSGIDTLLESCNVHYLAVGKGWQFDSEEAEYQWRDFMYDAMVEQFEKSHLQNAMRESFRILPDKDESYLDILGWNLMSYKVDWIDFVPKNGSDLIKIFRIAKDSLRIIYLDEINDGQHVRNGMGRMKAILNPVSTKNYRVRDFSEYGMEIMQVAYDREMIEKKLKRGKSEVKLETATSTDSIVNASCLLIDQEHQLQHRDKVWTIRGTGNGKDCFAFIEHYMDVQNEKCIENTNCFLHVLRQLPQSSFLVTGNMRGIVEILDRAQESSSDKEFSAKHSLLVQKYHSQFQIIRKFLAIPNATLSPLAFELAEAVCSISKTFFKQALSRGRKDLTTPNQLEQNLSYLCMELCFVAVALKKLEHFHENPLFYLKADTILTPYRKHDLIAKDPQILSLPVEPFTFGAFLHIVLEQFDHEDRIQNELLAFKIQSGIPIGWHMSTFLSIAACLLLYYTSVSRPGRLICRRLYPRFEAIISPRSQRQHWYSTVGRKYGKSKCQGATMLSSIYFVDDVSD